MAARSTARGSSSARRTRTKRATGSPLASARAITSSGEGANRPRSTQAKPGRRPRARMSSLKLERLASGCSSRVADEVARALARGDQPARGQLVQGLPDRGPRHVEPLGQHPLRRQGLAILEPPAGDGGRDPFDQLQIERRGRVRIGPQLVRSQPWRRLGAASASMAALLTRRGAADRRWPNRCAAPGLTARPTLSPAGRCRSGDTSTTAVLPSSRSRCR